MTETTSMPLKGKKIMWVEDDSFLNDIIAQKLSKQGCELMNATNGEDALKIIEKNAPDVLFLDILLPGMSGFELLEKIRETPKGKGLPVIILSNFDQEKDVRRAMQLGAKKYLVKATVNLDALVGEIKRAMA